MSSLEGFFAATEATGDILVHVQPHYDVERSHPGLGRFVWHYHIRIENRGHESVRLIDRHWIITDGRGIRHEVEGEGVVGEQPVIAPGAAFDYVSACPLPTPSGMMQGSYGMMAADGRRFRVGIPPFDLLSPDSRRFAN